MKRDALFSDCGKYRYYLSRIWDDSLPIAQCIGLNPSTANANSDDPTISKLTQIIKHNDFGGFYMTNLFSIISPYPDTLRTERNPLMDNDKWLIDIYDQCDRVIFCWGNFKQAEYRAKKIIKMFPHSSCFGQNKNGSPKHPLYLKKQTIIRDFI